MGILSVPKNITNKIGLQSFAIFGTSSTWIFQSSNEFILESSMTSSSENDVILFFFFPKSCEDYHVFYINRRKRLWIESNYHITCYSMRLVDYKLISFIMLKKENLNKHFYQFRNRILILFHFLHLLNEYDVEIFYLSITLLLIHNTWCKQ